MVRKLGENIHRMPYSATLAGIGEYQMIDIDLARRMGVIPSRDLGSDITTRHAR